MGLIAKEQLLQLLDLQTKDIDVPDFGGQIRIRELTVRDSNQIAVETSAFPDEKEKGFEDFCRVLSRCIVDENCNSVFTVDQIEQIGKRYRNALIDIHDQICTLSGLGKREEIEKNSEAVQTADSSSS